jgi:hypothetical protein
MAGAEQKYTRFRKLCIAWSVACVVLCLLMIVLWVRSYSVTDGIHSIHSRGQLAFTSFPGRIRIAQEFSQDPRLAVMQGTDFTSVPMDDATKIVLLDKYDKPMLSFLGIKAAWFSSYRTYTVVIPDWFLTAVFMFAATAPWIRQLKWRFSFRTLLIAMTLLAVVLGLVVWAAKK